MLRSRGVEVEESDECALADVAHIADLGFAGDMGLWVPEGVSLVESRQTGWIDDVGGRRRTVSPEQARHCRELDSVYEMAKAEDNLCAPRDLDSSGVNTFDCSHGEYGRPNLA